MGVMAGFSLMELLVVLVLLGFMAGITAPSMGHFLDGIKLKKQIAKVMADFRYGRIQAIATGKAVTVNMADDESGLRYRGGVSGSRSLDLGEDGSLRLDPLEITFYPEGQATPATVTLTIGERERTFIVDPLTAMTMPQ